MTPSKQIKPININLYKNLPLIVFIAVIICSAVAFELGGQVVCLNTGGTMLINQRCTKIEVEEYGICKESYTSNRYFIMNSTNITIEAFP